MARSSPRPPASLVARERTVSTRRRGFLAVETPAVRPADGGRSRAVLRLDLPHECLGCCPAVGGPGRRPPPWTRPGSGGPGVGTPLRGLRGSRTGVPPNRHPAERRDGGGGPRR